MKVYLRDYLSQTVDSSRITSAFHFFDPDNREGGYLIGLISASSKTQFEASNVTRFVWNGIVDEFSGSTDGSIERLKDTISAGEEKLVELLRNDPSEEVGVDLNFSIVHFVRGNLYFGFFGSSNIHIFHEDELVDVSSVLKDSKVSVGSAQILDEDVVLLTSDLFWNSVNFDIEKEFAFKELLQEIEITQIELGSGVVMASPGVDFEMLLLEDSMREVGLLPGAAVVSSTVIDPESDDNTGLPEQSHVGGEATEEDDVEKLVEDQEELDYLESEEQFDEHDGVDKNDINDLNSQEDDQGDHQVSSDQDPGDQTTKEDLTLISRITGFFGAILASVKLFLSRAYRKIRPGEDLHTGPSPSSVDKARSWTNRYMMNKHGRKAWFKKTKAKISQTKISTPSMDKLKVGGYREDSLRRKRFMILGATVLVIIFLFFGVRAANQFKVDSELHKDFQAFYEEAEGYIDQAEKTMNTENESAELALMSLQKLIEEKSYELDSLSEEDRSLYTELNGRVLGVSDVLGKVIEVNEDNENFEMFVETKLEFTEKSQPTDIAIYRDERVVERLIVTDAGNKAVYSVNVSDGTVTKIPDPNSLVQSPQFVDVGVDGIYVYDSKNGVLKAPFAEAKTQIEAFKALSGASASDFPIEEPEEFAVLTNTDNLYLIDSETTAIYKSSRTATGSYGLPFKYFSNELLDGATDFFADFSIYTTSENSNPFNRFIFDSESGNLVSSPLTIGGMRDGFDQITAGYTGGTLDQKLYLFDPGQQRILAFEKPSVPENRHPGQMILKAQYLYRGDKDNVFENVSDFVVDSQESLIFVLDGTRIWSIGIK